MLVHPRFKDVWNQSAADKFGRLAQGIKGRVKAKDTIRFIHKHEVPKDRFKDFTYIKFVCKIRTKKKVSISYMSHHGRKPHQLSG